MTQDSSASKLRVSLVVPMRDEEGSISKLICSILSQKLTPDEIILVDAGSQDRTVALARELIADDKRFHILEAGPAWPGKARNLGVQAASCEWIAFTDAGISLDPNWLQELVNTAKQKPEPDVVYGSFEPRICTILDRCAALTWISPRHLHDGVPMRGPVVPSALIRKQVIEAVGGFPDFRATEDLIFMENLEKHGSKIAWQPLAKVKWSLPPTLSKTFARFRLYSRHNVYAERQRYWHYGVLRFYALASVLAIAITFWDRRWALLVFPFGMAARVLKSLWQHRKDWRLGVLLNPVHFLMMIVLLLTLDVATFTGWIEATVDRVLKRNFFARHAAEA